MLWLIWVFTGRANHWFVLSCSGSYTFLLISGFTKVKSPYFKWKEIIRNLYKPFPLPVQNITWVRSINPTPKRYQQAESHEDMGARLSTSGERRGQFFPADGRHAINKLKAERTAFAADGCRAINKQKAQRTAFPADDARLSTNGKAKTTAFPADGCQAINKRKAKRTAFLVDNHQTIKKR